MAQGRGSSINLVGGPGAATPRNRVNISALPVGRRLIVHDMVNAVFVTLEPVVETDFVQVGAKRSL